MPDLIIDEDDFQAAVAIVYPYLVRTGVDRSFTDAERQLIDAIAVVFGATRATAIAPFERLFAGGPDTVCRTTWRPEDGALARGQVATSLTECVEVPMDELRSAFDEARNAR